MEVKEIKFLLLSFFVRIHKMSYNLFLDDEREPYYNNSDTVICRSTAEAKKYVVANGMPSHLYLDHDLGGDDTAMVFLKWLANEYWDGTSPIPDYSVHSSNPAGRANIISFMETWWKVSNNFLPPTMIP